MTAPKPTWLSVVSDWWQWSPEDVADFRSWAALNREPALEWLRQECAKALEQRKAGHRTVEDWIAHGRRKHA